MFMYLCRYKGYDAFWTFGDTGTQYHWWTEIIIGNNVYAFDQYPSMAKSFQHRTSTVEKQTTIGGFPWLGYFYSREKDKNGKSLISVADKGIMGGMKDIAAVPVNPNGGIATITKTYPDGVPDFSWSLSVTGETEQITMASIDKFYPTEKDRTNVNVVFDAVADEKLTAHTVKVGTKISMEGAAMYSIEKLEKTSDGFRATKEANWDALRKQVDNAEGRPDELYRKGDYFTILQEGYYLIDMFAWNKFQFEVDPKSPSYGAMYYRSLYRNGYIVIHVLK